ncbi:MULTISPECIES: substrate-binding domain-containing protein [unclassified Nonomuraea]|uniref:sugar ABC transporter substrate-binding protein n=1 Tax=unclassified Nonomuraea TaxID=2593643 RepID=UPI0033EF439D
MIGISGKRQRRVLAAAAIAVLALSACGAEPATTTGGSTVGPSASNVDYFNLPTSTGASCSMRGKKMIFVSVLRENPVLQIMAQGAIDGAKKAGFASEQWVASQGFDEPGTVTLATQSMAQGVDGIVVLASSPTFYPMIARAKAMGIPVIQTHSPIAKGEAPGLLGQFYPDPTSYGKAAAEAIGARLKKAGKTGSIAIMQTSFIPNENAAAKAFTETMKAEYPQQHVLAPVAEGGDSSKAIATETSLVQAHQDLVAAFDTSGNGPVNWATTQKDTGRQLVVISMDYAKANLELVKSGSIFGIVAQPLYQEHYLAAFALAKAICRDPIAYDNPLSAPIVEQTRLAPYYELLSKVNIH